jgi:hypothetical protein
MAPQLTFELAVPSTQLHPVVWGVPVWYKPSHPHIVVALAVYINVSGAVDGRKGCVQVQKRQQPAVTADPSHLPVGSSGLAVNSS